MFFLVLVQVDISSITSVSQDSQKKRSPYHNVSFFHLADSPDEDFLPEAVLLAQIKRLVYPAGGQAVRQADIRGGVCTAL